MSEPQRFTNEPQGDERIRDLCRQIAQERNPEKVAELSKALRQLLRVQSDDARLKMEYLAMRHRAQIHAVPLPVDDGDSSPAASKIRAVLMFLGLVPRDREIEGNPAHVPEK